MKGRNFRLVELAVVLVALVHTEVVDLVPAQNG